ncbi:hypothetical protein [Herbidospora sp. NBRC 101105]|uniref:hypothetical protein n=1 Tax=Herbidospora sp. NBRC 101105 TaxID=3032195 RepID=UPI0024A15BE3|nr:hypothetical protein [Herbidospora sp. NBRC 101105]GLX95320.1 hypothetical protein Hesp01_32700 [Herbidospora sp. NBRC 101105]
MPIGLRDLTSSPWRNPTFWWWIAVVAAALPVLYSVLFELVRWAPGYGVAPILCPAGFFDEPTTIDRVEYFIHDLGDTLSWTLPLLFLLPALGLRKNGADETHLRAARWAFVVALTTTVLMSLDLNPVPPDECLMRQFGITPRSMSLGVLLAWATSPIMPILVAGAVAGRVRPGWSIVALPLAAVLVIAAQPIVDDRVAKIYRGPALTADGTHRYALLSSYGQWKTWNDGTSELYVVDLTTGKVTDVVWHPRSLEFATYTAATRDREPGHYVVSALGPRGRNSRLYRLTVNADGKAMLRESITPPLKGVVTAVAVSPGGRVAYGRAVDTNHYFTGVVAPDREWPSQSPNGLTWSSSTELLLPGGDTLNTNTGAPGRFHVDPDSPGMVTTLLPDGRHLTTKSTLEQHTISVYRGARKLATAFTVRGRILSTAVDATSTALLVGTENFQQVDDLTGNSTYQIVRVDLRPLIENPEATGELDLPQRLVWEGREPPAYLAW